MSNPIHDHDANPSDVRLRPVPNPMSPHEMPRREFLSASGASLTLGGALAAWAGAEEAASRSANERLRVGIIGLGTRGQLLADKFAELRRAGEPLDIVAVSDLYQVHLEKGIEQIEKQTGQRPQAYDDYRDMLAKKAIDVMVVATHDPWHARQVIDGLNAGVDIYCEKPMTHTIEEAQAVVEAWRRTGRVVQVGVQSTSMPVFHRALEWVNAGRLGKILQIQTAYSRNSTIGMTRFRPLTPEMTPKTINWKKFLGVEEGILPEVPFDREIFAHWRCYWPYGSGMYTDLFVHRVTGMLKATGLLYPARVVGAGGIFMEYDDRQVPDVATVVADFAEGVQLMITGTMVAQVAENPQAIRGHFGTVLLGGGESVDAFDFVPERTQITLDSRLKETRVEAPLERDSVSMHVKNFVDAVRAGKPELCNNTPELGAAAVTIVNLGVKSYRKGKAYHFDATTRRVAAADAGWALQWEKMSLARQKPRQVPGWQAGDHGSLIHPPEYMKLAGPWIDGNPPEERKN